MSRSRKKTRGRSRWGTWIVFIAVIAFVVLVLAASSSRPQTPPQTTGKVRAADFTVTDLSGNQFRLSDQRGKVVVVEFMTTRCPACKTQMPHLKNLWDRFQGRIVIISLSIDPNFDSPTVLSDYARSYGASWTWARDTTGIRAGYAVSATPTIAIIDRDGYIQFRHVGVADATTLVAEVESLLG